MIYHGDLFDVLPTLSEASVDACVTDPPYDLTSGKKGGSGAASVNLDSPYGRARIGTGNGAGGFMGHKWDGTGVAFKVETWREVYRVLKPGAHLLAFGAPRTFHRMTCAIEDAGFEIRDCLSWLYGQGFPKSLNVGDGRGTALKPAWEPVVMGRKPLSGTVAANVSAFGTGALNIDAGRVGADDTRRVKEGGRGQFPHEDDAWEPKTVTVGSESGRWPANVALDEAAASMLDEQSGTLRRNSDKFRSGDGAFKGTAENPEGIGASSGGAARFFYVAKPSRSERDEGIYTDERDYEHSGPRGHAANGDGSPRPRPRPRRNTHPTIKPVELMRWLVRLVTPEGGTVLDPFMGSGTTGMACAFELRPFIGVEREADYIQIAERRIASCAPLFQGGGE